MERNHVTSAMPHQGPPLNPAEIHRLQSRFPEFLGSSRPLIRLLQQIEKVISSDSTVLIHGESGTGKELVGRAIHRLSPRNSGPFICENCAAISPNLLDGELFGHDRGAFTGATSERAGLIESAEGGTLLLDEIGEMEAALQSKLLRVLQEREIRRVGSTRTRKVDFRLLAATHRDLEQEIQAGRFREDLRYRIDVLRVEIPPLRQRRQDIPLLCQNFLRSFCKKNSCPVPSFSADALTVLIGAPWKGNIRELRNEMERVSAAGKPRILVEDLSPSLHRASIPHPIARRLRAELGTDLRKLEEVVLGGIVRDVLTETDGNKAQAARILGIPKTTLYRRLERWHLLS
ncbi:MAG: sigma-54-dependent Fis family transcriptional regulator [Planctomycetes bacterium]|jgi:two-component system, NtrC family, response regulator HydG|nr:sigma-54-dependent Fis family transcriptional regulator [Planctomycetota bacterium]MBT6452371.1 sigma-54-dependent Fis family transcriptional regulator [Planctomycetota bacterium]MBT6784773.1 sigma-54-dependent Fis family transcriptional regulator [Planctomycetota bacterium]MBT6969511.1 sigma-54-dependent Fis family transcriptional regulator [Planctomycetota bacterium]MBT7104286.1 sigma-54-dependent Fis family transcriptional regulator [Planctomycetota bacterium]